MTPTLVPLVLGLYFPNNADVQRPSEVKNYNFTVTDKIWDAYIHVIHVRLNMTYQGLRVLGGDSVVHISRRDMFITKTIQKPPNITQPEFAACQKTAGMQTNAEIVFYSRLTDTPLFVDFIISGIAADKTPMIVHNIRECAENTTFRNYTDVKTFRKTGWPENDLLPWPYNSTIVVRPTCSAEEKRIGTGHAMYSRTVNLSTSFKEDHYVLVDTDRSCHYTVSSTFLEFALNKDHDRIQEQDANEWGNGNNNDEHTVSADAHYGHAATFDFYFKFCDRILVNHDERTIYSRVHVGKEYSNSFWYDVEMSYGDGDDVRSHPFVSLEAVAHAFTHGLIENTANLEYTGESGGLSEATSDIMSTIVYYYTFGIPNYFIGESIYFQPGTFERSLVQPSSDIVNYRANGRMDNLGNPEGSYDCYCQNIGYLDVHMSSGVANHFFYLLAEGTDEYFEGPSKTCDESDTQNATTIKTIEPIGRLNAADIWYRALTLYFVSHTNYTLARNGTIQAAQDLFGVNSKEVETVRNAWGSVLVK